MTILAVLIGLLISHFATGVRHVRRFEPLLAPAHWAHRSWPRIAWLVMAVLILTSLLVAGLAEWILIGLAGTLGWFLLAIFVFIYCLGPRDLDKDIQLLLERGPDSADPEVAATLRAMRLRPDSDAQAAASAVHHAALSRWFGLLFWFVVLGIPGALLYRLVRAGLQEPFDTGSIDWLARLRLVLDWPVLVLAVISAGLCSDLDRVIEAWRQQPEESPLFGVTPDLLDRVAAIAIQPDATVSDALASAHRLVWRMLILWLVAMSLILIAGWLV
jgi:AmpE protein